MVEVKAFFAEDFLVSEDLGCGAIGVGDTVATVAHVDEVGTDLDELKVRLLFQVVLFEAF